MKLTRLMVLKDITYYECKGDLVWVFNKSPYRERSAQGVLESLRIRKEI